MKRQRKKTGSSTSPGSVRIIAGTWRGRRLGVTDVEGLRPSGDRARETLFNWLQPHLRDANCVDLFAGTGVLGLEAVSRGAAGAWLIERNPQAAIELRNHVDLLGAVNVRVVETDALAWLQQRPADSVDVIFIDPPFGEDLAPAVKDILDGGKQMKQGGLAYFETARSENAIQLSGPWLELREKTIGEVRMQLLQCTG